MILTLITLGKFLETRAKGKTGDAIRQLMDLSPKTADVLRDGIQVTIPIEDNEEVALLLNPRLVQVEHYRICRFVGIADIHHKLRVDGITAV